ncbi:MAG: hypothetical protein ACPHOH_02800 [Porticoccaceae bacterium]
MFGSELRSDPVAQQVHQLTLPLRSYNFEPAASFQILTVFKKTKSLGSNEKDEPAGKLSLGYFLRFPFNSDLKLFHWHKKFLQEDQEIPNQEHTIDREIGFIHSLDPNVIQIITGLAFYRYA